MRSKSKVFKTAKELDAIKTSGTWKDASCRNLYLQVTKSGDNPATRSWLFRFMLNGRARSMGLDSYPLVSLVEAREAAEDALRLVRRGIDPIEARNADRAQVRHDAARAIPFREFAEKYIRTHEASWKNQKHKDQWRNTMAQYVYPVIGNVTFQSITNVMVRTIIEKDWLTKNQSMNRIRGRIERIWSAAKAEKLCGGENPARWRDNLSELLPAPKRLQRVVHHPALPYAQAPLFTTKLRTQKGIAAAALEFAILTAARTSEVIAARWSEFDLEAKNWTVPADRIKCGKQHVVPLSAPAIAVLERLKGLHAEFVFSSHKNKHLGDNAMLVLLDRMGYGHITTHGMRSTFRTWVGEQTNYAHKVAEVCLAHVEGSETVAAYERCEVPGTLYLDKRRDLMAAWAAYLGGDATTNTVSRAAE